MKKFFTVFISMTLGASLCMMAESFNVVSDGIKFTIDTAEEFNYAYVTGAENRNVTSIDIPESVEFEGVEYPVRLIMKSAFNYYSNLQEVKFPASLKYIDGFAFMQTGLKNIELPEGLEYIGNSAFANCNSLECVTLPGCLSIDNFAFGNDSKLTSFTLPENTVELSPLAFRGSKQLEQINVDENNAVYSSNDGVLYSKDGKTLVIYPAGKDLEPEIPEGVTAIGPQAFYQTPIQFVYMPSTLETIGEQAFYGCTGMEDIELGVNVKTIGNGAFENCSQIVNIVWNEAIESIGPNAFSKCSKITSVTIPNSVISLGDNAFNFCYALDEVTIGNGLTELGYGAFSYNSALTKVNFSEGLLSLGNNAFSSCSKLQEIYLPNSLETINENAFWGCRELKEMHIGPNVANIETSAFLMVANLENLYIKAVVPPATASNAFSSYNATLHVPAESVEAYSNDDVWKNFANIEGESFTGIDTASTSNQSFTVENGKLIIDADITVTIFNTAGVMIKTIDGLSVTDLTDLPSSVYIISDGYKTLKFIN